MLPDPLTYNLTDAQRRAVTALDRNLIVVAGAGSGKTSVLVNRYLYLLRAYPEWELNQLVAITFTNKAAGEMRDRVRERLHTLVSTPNEDTALWERRLRAMDSARIETIHAFCASLLRANAAEAGLDPTFTLLDEVEADILRDTAIDDAVRVLANDEHPALHLFGLYGVERVRTALRDTLSHPVPSDERAETIWERWYALAETDARRTIDQTREQLALLNRFEPMGTDSLSGGWMLCNRVLDQFAALSNDEPLITFRDVLAELADLNFGKIRKSAAWGNDADEAYANLKTAREGARAVRDAVDHYERFHTHTLEWDAAQWVAQWSALIRATAEQYDALKMARYALDFDDLETRTRAVLDDYPQVAARYVGLAVQHLLVDEFQDTNAAQWAIIQRLIDLARPGTLFVVGDPKQSIYAFRGADISVFDTVEGLITADPQVGERVTLAQSFRTHSGLVAPFNALFSALLVRERDNPVAAYQVVYGEPMLPRPAPPPANAPAVELLIVDERLLPDSSADDEGLRDWEARAVAARLNTLIAEGRPVYDRHRSAVRPVRWGDIALLFQSGAAITLFEEAFKGANVPYVTVSGRGYYGRQEVWDLLNLLRALENPYDDLSLAAALRSPLFNLSDDGLLTLRLLTQTDNDSVRLREPSSHEKLLPLWKALPLASSLLPTADVPRAQFAHETLLYLRGLAGRVTIAELLTEALRGTNYLAILTTLPDGARRRGNVEKLLEKAATGGQITLSAFIQYLSDMRAREVREGEAVITDENAVTLMTVHASKGLEFPIVVLAQAQWKRHAGDHGLLHFDDAMGLTCAAPTLEQDADEDAWKPFAHTRAKDLQTLREEAERRRLLYVAATRAQDMLIVSGGVTRTQRGELGKIGGWLAWLDEVMDFSPHIAAQTEGLDLPLPAWNARLLVPPYLPPTTLETAASALRDWQPQGDPMPFPLLNPTPHPSASSTRMLSIEQVSANAVSNSPSPFTERGLGGEVSLLVRHALSWWDGAISLSSDEAAQRLRTHAWKLGVLDNHDLDIVVSEAQALLAGVLGSPLHAHLRTARQVLHDVPITYQTNDNTLYGVIDVLAEFEENHWALISYNTDLLAAEPTDAALTAHAEQYQEQMAIYVRAAQTLLHTDTVDVYIHYIRYGYTAALPTAL